MNYSNDSRNKIEKNNKSKAKQVKKKGKVTALRMIIMVIIIGMFAVVGAGLGVFIGIIKSSPDVTTIDLKPQGNYTSFVYDDAGNEIASFAPADNREYAKLSEIPLHLQHAVVATEDERFYEHNGIDIKGIFRAIVKNLTSRDLSEGASTITQQLVKNNVLSTDKKFTRKIQEQYLAIKFEDLYDKDTILEYYLNTIGLSQGVSGVQAASKRYFGKDVSELNLTESVVIAVITQRPTYYDPIINPENNWKKVQVVLQKMEEQGYITAEEHAAALLETPYDNIQKVHVEFQSKSTRSSFVDALFLQLVSDLQDLGYSEADAKKQIYGGGLKIYSTVNSQMQTIADKYIDDDSQYPENLYKVQIDYSVTGKKADGTAFDHNIQVLLDSDDEIQPFIEKKKEEWGITSADTYTDNLLRQPQPQASFVLMDYTNGQVKALSGGRGDKTNLGFNYATQAKRQPGSTFKVLASYAPALDLGVLSPGSEIINEAVTYTLWDGSSWSPKNWDGNYSGSYTVREAIANSMNVIAIKTIKQVGIDTAFDYLKRFGFTTLSDSDKVLALPLGGITNGVTALELNAAYGAIANEGVYIKPVYYTEVRDSNGNKIIDNTGENIAENSHTVIKSSTARLLTDMMTEVVDGPSKHTGSTVRKYFTNMPVAGKTGTTNDSKDLVFTGYTPYYVATIWTGYSQPEAISSRNGGNSYHMKIWAEIMNEIHENLDYKSFPKVDIQSSGVSEIKICSLSGKRATALCEADPDHVVKSEFFTNSNAPKGYCDIHEEVEICTESNKIANEYCPVETRKKVTRVKQVINGIVQEDAICDIHGSKPEETPIESPDNGLIPDDSIPSDPNGPISPPSDNQTSPSPDSSTPPTVVPSVSPNIDDEDDFVIPQY